MEPAVERVPIPVQTRWPGGRTNAYVVAETDALLVDPGAVHPALTATVDAVEVGHIAVTHAHRDHAGAVARYAHRTGATVWALARGASAFEAGAGIEPDRLFRGGDTVGPVTVMTSPGHAPDHVSYRVGNEALVGDLVVAEGSVVVGGSGADLRSYLVSLRRLRQAGLRRLHPGHGRTVEDPTATLDRLLAHRLDRERRVLAAVEAGAERLDDIVDAAYEKDLTGVEDLARLTVAAHLEKLGRAGRLHWDGDRAVPS